MFTHAAIIAQSNTPIAHLTHTTLLSSRCPFVATGLTHHQLHRGTNFLLHRSIWSEHHCCSFAPTLQPGAPRHHQPILEVLPVKARVRLLPVDAIDEELERGLALGPARCSDWRLGAVRRLTRGAASCSGS